MAPSQRPTPPPHTRTVPCIAAVLLIAALAALGACSPVSGPAQVPDPGIAANLAVVQSRTDVLFNQLDRNASMPFAEYDAQYYRPLLEMVGETQRLARIHHRSERERTALDQLAQTYQDMRTLHREGKLSYESLQTLRTKLTNQTDTVMQMEQH